MEQYTPSESMVQVKILLSESFDREIEIEVAKRRTKKRLLITQALKLGFEALTKENGRPSGAGRR